jgi:glycosyltransferase involved in cell wall biosynthesis
MIDVYITLSEFARQKFIEGGLPSEKIVVKPNFIDPDPGPGEGRGGYALFVGRLSAEKGVETLLAAWEQLERQTPLRIVGEGPLSDQVAEAARKLPNVDWLGRQPSEKVLALMKDAQILLFPSVCNENSPLVIAEAYAAGLPVIASDLGVMSSMIDHGRTGLLFRPGDSQNLAAQVEQALCCPASLARMRPKVRAEFEAKYTAERNYEMLMDIYGSAIARKVQP